MVDSTSIEVHRRAKRAKTDRMDVNKLPVQLWQYLQTGKPSAGAIVVDWQIKLSDQARSQAA